MGFDKAKNEYGLTVKQERFAQEVAKGLSQTEAYRIAYTCDNMKDGTVHGEASRLMGNPQVAARVNMLFKEVEARMLKDTVRLKQHVLKRLVEESEDFENGTATSRVAATVALGKTNVVRLYTEETEEDKKKDAAELERMLKDRLRDYFKSPEPSSGTQTQEQRSVSDDRSERE